MGKYFGTDGFRGKANETLTAQQAFRIGQFLGYFFGKEKKARIVLGKDPRLSGYLFESALTSGLTAAGADVYLLHVTTTPCVAYVTKTEDFDCGIMVSASHNPYTDNGIKLFSRDGEKMEEDVLGKIEAYLDVREEIPQASGEKIGKAIDYAAGRNRYIGYLISTASHSYKDKRIGLDCANGSAWMIAKSVFETLGAQTYVIANEPDGTNINRECGSTHMEKIQNLVLKEKLDAAFAFDGDADRCLAVDEKGNLITGDHILYLYACYMKKQGMLNDQRVVSTIMSNYGLYKALDAEGIGYEKTDVGDKYVWECMRRQGHLLGGEQSGHVIFARFSNTGDGILTAIRVMEVMLTQKQSLSALVQNFVFYPQVLKNVRVNDRQAALLHPAVRAEVEKASAALEGRGRVLLRESGTEPVVRVMAEAENPEECEKIVDNIIESIKRCGA